jgi:GTP-binding protein
MFSIAIIGRPNVGKSTLFNKLIGKKFAITDDTPGVTRDRREAQGRLADIKFKLIDTAGLENEIAKGDLSEKMLEQTEIAVYDANLCFFVVDGKQGITNIDLYFAEWLRKKNKDVILIANKRDGNEGEIFDKEYYRLGFDQAIAISAEHKEGFHFLYEKIIPFYQKYQKDFAIIEEELQKNADKKLQIAVIGRPNAGKSTFLNKIIGKNRLITGPEAGITRDSIAIDYKFEEKEIRFIDTAGIRKKSNITQKLEKFSLEDSFRAINFAQIVILLIDANNAIDHQDLAIANLVIKEGRGLLIGINKMDIIDDPNLFMRKIREKLALLMPEISTIPIVGISAKSGFNINKLLKFSFNVFDQWQKYITTSKLNEFLQYAKDHHQPIMVKGKEVKIKYITQAKKNPPTFVIFTNYPKAIKGSYERYLKNSLRDFFGLEMVVIRIIVKKSDNPYKDIKYKKFSKKTHKKIS